MSVISSTRGNPQASDVAVQTVTPMLGGASREDLQTVISSVDAEAAKLFEDRNIQLVDGGLITFTGTALQFTEALKLHINSQVAGGAPTVIDLAATTRSLSASGRMLYAVINRSAGTATVTADATTLPAVTSANQEVVLIAKRVDAGDGTQRCYFRNGATYNAGNTARLGSSGSGSGSGEINEIANSSDATNWVASGAGVTVATTTTLSDLPLNGVISTAIKVTPVSGTDYARYRWTAATALKGKKLKIEWWQHALAGYAAGDLKVEIYRNAASDYSGAYTEFALSTDVSGTSAIPAGDGKYTSSFDSDTSDYYEIRLVRVAGTSAITFANLIVGPGIQPQGAINAAPLALSTTYDNLGTVANNDVTYTRYGSRMKVQGRVTTGTTAAGIAAVVLPSGFTLATGTSGLSNQASGIMVGSGRFITSGGTAVDQVPATFAIFYDGSTTTKLFISDRTQSSAFVKRNGNDMFATGDIFVYEFDVPVAEWAGQGTTNTAQNDVEYLTNTNTSTSASDTTSFGYGSGGTAIVAVSSAGATVKKRARTQRPMGAGAGKPILEVSPDGIIWLQGMFPYMESATEKYGMRIVAGGTAQTDMDVEFGGDGASGTEAWSTFTTWKWRVTVQQPGVAVGFGLADATNSGLMSASSQTLGGAKTWNDIQTFKSSGGAVASGSYDAAGAWTFGPASAGSTVPHVINGSLTSGGTSVGDDFRAWGLYANANFNGVSNRKTGSSTVVGGSALFLECRTVDTATVFGVYSNLVADADGAAATIKGAMTQAGVWSFGPATANNYDGQRHIINGALYAGNVTSTSVSGYFVIGTNAKFGATNVESGRTNTVTGGAAIALMNRTVASQSAIQFYTSLPGDATSTSGPLVAEVTHQGIWTFGNASSKTTSATAYHTSHYAAYCNVDNTSGAFVGPAINFISSNYVPMPNGSSNYAVKSGTGYMYLRCASPTTDTDQIFQAVSTQTNQTAGNLVTGTENAGLTLTAGGTLTNTTRVSGIVHSTFNGGSDGTAEGNHVLRIRNLYAPNSSTGAGMMTFMDINGDTCGSITINPNANSAAFNTSSDERLKTNVQDFDAASIVDQIEIKSFERITALGNIEHGVLAQDLHEVYPNAVVVGGEDSQIDPWCVDYSKLVPILLKAHQELKAQLEDLNDDYQTYKASHP